MTEGSIPPIGGADCWGCPCAQLELPADAMVTLQEKTVGDQTDAFLPSESDCDVRSGDQTDAFLPLDTPTRHLRQRLDCERAALDATASSHEQL